jgi:predicted dehydrogenase
MNWRWNYNTGGGQLLDWIGHHCDIAHWGMDMDTDGPSEIEGKGEFPPADAIWNTCTKYRIELKYPKDITMIIAGGYPDIRSGTKWIGTDGWVWVDRGGFDATNTDWFQQIPADKYTVKLYKSAIPGHLGLISMLVGRKIKWDVAKEVIVGDAEASKLLTRPYRQPWKMV